LYTLASTPEYLQPLREEIRTVMAENNGTITTRALQQMEKLDSYMKESMRFYPANYSKGLWRLYLNILADLNSVLQP
jgi:hypothetical protein